MAQVRTGGVTIVEQRRTSVIMREEVAAFHALEAVDHQAQERQQALVAKKKSRHSMHPRHKKSDADREAEHLDAELDAESQ